MLIASKWYIRTINIFFLIYFCIYFLKVWFLKTCNANYTHKHGCIEKKLYKLPSGSICTKVNKKNECNVFVYCISSIIVITKKLIYAATLILLIYEVLFLLWKRVFVIRFYKTTAHGNVEKMTSRWRMYS